MVSAENRRSLYGVFSGYVNVCAAVCLLLLVGGLSPRISAAPHRGRDTMDRQKRAASEENSAWANPCDYRSLEPTSTKDYSPKDAENVALMARNALTTMMKYKDKFATVVHSYPKFDDLIPEWNVSKWLSEFQWFKEANFPQKDLYQNIDDANMDKLMTRIYDVMPNMYKGLKMVVAGLYALTNDGLDKNVISDELLKKDMDTCMEKVQNTLCYFYDIMKKLNLPIMPLMNSEIPDMRANDKQELAFLIYRDALNYLEFVEQVFLKLHDVNPAFNA